MKNTEKEYLLVREILDKLDLEFDVYSDGVISVTRQILERQDNNGGVQRLMEYYEAIGKQLNATLQLSRQKKKEYYSSYDDFKIAESFIHFGINPVDLDFYSLQKSDKNYLVTPFGFDEPNPFYTSSNLNKIKERAAKIDNLAKKTSSLKSYSHQLEGAEKITTTEGKFAYLILAGEENNPIVTMHMDEFQSLLDKLCNDGAGISIGSVISIALNNLAENCFWAKKILSEEDKNNIGVNKGRVFFKSILLKLPSLLAGRAIKEHSIKEHILRIIPASLSFWSLRQEDYREIAEPFLNKNCNALVAALYGGCLFSPSNAFAEDLIRMTKDVQQVRSIAKKSFSLICSTYSFETKDERKFKLKEIAERLDAEFEKEGCGPVLRTELVNPALRSAEIGLFFYEEGLLAACEPEQEDMFQDEVIGKNIYKKCMEVAVDLKKRAFVENIVDHWMNPLTHKVSSSVLGFLSSQDIFLTAFNSGLIDIKKKLSTEDGVKAAIKYGVDAEVFLRAGVEQKTKKDILSRDLDL